LSNEDKLRAEFERLKSGNESPLEVDESNIEELRVALLTELDRQSPDTLDDFNEILDRELSVFKENSKYDFVRDIKDAY
jgi:hypothetical protein